MQADFVPNAEDQVEALANSSPKLLGSRLGNSTFWLVLGAVGAVLIARGETVWGAVLVVVSLGFLWWWWLGLPSKLRGQVESASLAVECRADFNEEGIEYAGGLGSGKLPWTAVWRWKETANLFLLFLGENTYQVFPKRAFHPDQIPEFRLLLRRSIRGRQAAEAADPNRPVWNDILLAFGCGLIGFVMLAGAIYAFTDERPLNAVVLLLISGVSCRQMVRYARASSKR